MWGPRALRSGISRQFALHGFRALDILSLLWFTVSALSVPWSLRLQNPIVQKRLTIVGEPLSTRYAPHWGHDFFFFSGKCVLFYPKFCQHGDDPTPWATPAHCQCLLKLW